MTGCPKITELASDGETALPSVEEKKEYETSFNFLLTECNLNIVALLIVKIRAFEKITPVDPMKK